MRMPQQRSDLIVEELLKAGANSNIKNKEGKTASMIAEEINNTIVIDLISQKR